ncbi:hypothetical protein OH460_08230 [Vibrio sp. Makdt]|uniref:hypothetical protein n=1 Tax=Vibrio sp. Makdt TaxID=2998828 RepID=UPI0022CD24D2|nr:hypothetical protein [Vibrio sp. Makdt]MDA0152286.1 hypothetical protein [Vibrio sp. Makdt]
MVELATTLLLEGIFYLNESTLVLVVTVVGLGIYTFRGNGYTKPKQDHIELNELLTKNKMAMERSRREGAGEVRTSVVCHKGRIVDGDADLVIVASTLNGRVPDTSKAHSESSQAADSTGDTSSASDSGCGGGE